MEVTTPVTSYAQVFQNISIVDFYNKIIYKMVHFLLPDLLCFLVVLRLSFYKYRNTGY